MSKSWREALIGKPGNGIPGVTKGINKPSEEERGMSVRQDEGYSFWPRLKTIISAPVDLLAVGAKATAGAAVLGTARKIGMTDQEGVGEKKQKGEKKQPIKHRMIKDWATEIDNLIRNSAELKKDPKRKSGLVLGLVGIEGMARVDRIIGINQRLPTKVKPTTEEEIEMATEVMAENDGSSWEQQVEKTLNTIKINNLVTVGDNLIDTLEVDKLTELRDQSEILITDVSWWNGLKAALLGANGIQNKAISGGYVVKINKGGNIGLNVGQDTNEIAPPHEITVDTDIPSAYEAALVVAAGRAPGLNGIFGKLIRSMMGYKDGEVPLLPGLVKIGKSGGDLTDGFPALNARREAEKINDAVRAGRTIDNRLNQLNVSEIEVSVENIIQKLEEGAKQIPRQQVVLNIIKETVKSGGNPPIKEVIQTPETKKIEPEEVSESEIMNDIKLTETTEKDKVITKETVESYLERVRINNMDLRAAKIIINREENFRKDLIEKFGKKQGNKIANAIARRARSIVKQNQHWKGY